MRTAISIHSGVSLGFSVGCGGAHPTLTCNWFSQMRVDGIGCLIRCRYIECTEKWLLTAPAIENSFFEDSGKKFVFW